MIQEILKSPLIKLPETYGIRQHGRIDALGNSTLPREAFQRWLEQDYIFLRSRISFQSTPLQNSAPRTENLIAGLAAPTSDCLKPVHHISIAT